MPWLVPLEPDGGRTLAVISGLMALCVAAEWALLELVERLARAGALPHLAARTARTRRWYVALFGWWCAELAVLFRLWDAIRSFDRVGRRRRVRAST